MLKYLLALQFILFFFAFIPLLKSQSTKFQIFAQSLIALLIPVIGPVFIRSLHTKEKWKDPNAFPPSQLSEPDNPDHY